MADAEDLKSSGDYLHTGSNPVPAIQIGVTGMDETVSEVLLLCILIIQHMSRSCPKCFQFYDIL